MLWSHPSSLGRSIARQDAHQWLVTPPPHDFPKQCPFHWKVIQIVFESNMVFLRPGRNVVRMALGKQDGLLHRGPHLEALRHLLALPPIEITTPPSRAPLLEHGSASNFRLPWSLPRPVSHPASSLVPCQFTLHLTSQLIFENANPIASSFFHLHHNSKKSLTFLTSLPGLSWSGSC